jgi:hypothetical protein
VKYHCCVDLDALIKGRDIGPFRVVSAEELPVPQHELVAHAVILKARGFDVLPTCSKYDEKGNCRGHEAWEDAS